MSEWYSRADRERMAQGLPPQEHSALTEEDYKDLLELALKEAVDRSPAKDLVGTAKVCDLGEKLGGCTRNELDAEGNPTGKYDIEVNWGDKMRELAADPEKGPSHMAHLATAAFHEVRHVEQMAMTSGDLPIKDRRDMEIATQTTVNDLYPTLYKRGYGNTVTEVDANVEGLEGALAFFDAHPGIKSRYGFDFREAIMQVDVYDVLEDGYQLTEATPEDLVAAMKAYRDVVYDDPWKPDRPRSEPVTLSFLGAEYTFMLHLNREHGIEWADLEKMDNDERNVLLIQNAIEVIDDPDARLVQRDARLVYDMSDYRAGPVMSGRLDVAIRDENDMKDQVQEQAPAGPGPAWKEFQGSAFTEPVPVPVAHRMFPDKDLFTRRSLNAPSSLHAPNSLRAPGSHGSSHRATGPRGCPATWSIEAPTEDAGPSFGK
ncbi:hypothetical protein [uncultured Alistipes sp.]|uniref:hypothetical protein n=1 Tax=uncultured Alistipes sp. TaxID=538949 RepID=UPI00272C1F35|nr:hypothetical protein [uncultured Alistipes sp.]